MAVQKVFAPSSSNDWSTGVTYVGPPNDWVLQNRFNLIEDEYGANVLTRSWKLKRSVPIQTKLPKRGWVDPIFKTLQVFDFRVEGDGAFQTLYVNFNGWIVRPTAPQIRPLKTRNIRQQKVYASPRPGAINLTRFLTLKYIAPGIIKRYALPESPKFRDPYEDFDFDEEIKVLSIVLDDALVLDPEDFPRLMQLYNLKSQQKSVRVDLQDDQEGAVHRITEVIERQIIQEPIFNSTKF